MLDAGRVSAQVNRGDVGLMEGLQFGGVALGVGVERLKRWKLSPLLGFAHIDESSRS